jgi:hypothetical protein
MAALTAWQALVETADVQGRPARARHRRRERDRTPRRSDRQEPRRQAPPPRRDSRRPDCRLQPTGVRGRRACGRRRLGPAGAQTPLGVVPPCATVASDRGDLRMWTLPARRPATPSATCSLSRPRRAGSHRRTRRPRPAACARRPALGCWRRPHGRTISPPDSPSQARGQVRLNACRVTSSTHPHRSFERKLAVRPGQPVTGGTQRGTMQGHRRNDHGEGPMNRSMCGCQHPVGRVCLYCVAQDPPVSRPACRRAGRGRLALRGLSGHARR